MPETLLEHWCSPIELRTGEVLPPPPPESKREAKAFLAWLRAAAEACGVDPEPYLKKLEGELRRREGKSTSSPELALPVWRSLPRGPEEGREAAGGVLRGGAAAALRCAGGERATAQARLSCRQVPAF